MKPGSILRKIKLKKITHHSNTRLNHNDEHFTNGYQVTGNDVGYGNRDDYGYDFLDSSLNNDANNGSLQRNKTLNQIINYGAIDFMEDFEN